jgi:hypothetical protein
MSANVPQTTNLSGAAIESFDYEVIISHLSDDLIG